MRGTKTVGMCVGIRVVLDFQRNRQGISVIIILRTEKLLHKKSFSYQWLLFTFFPTYDIYSSPVRLLRLNGL